MPVTAWDNVTATVSSPNHRYMIRCVFHLARPRYPPSFLLCSVRLQPPPRRPVSGMHWGGFSFPIELSHTQAPFGACSPVGAHKFLPQCLPAHNSGCEYEGHKEKEGPNPLPLSLCTALSKGICLFQKRETPQRQESSPLFPCSSPPLLSAQRS